MAKELAVEVKKIARQCGFELAGIAAALPSSDFGRYSQWVDQGHAGSMGYLTDHRAEIRSDPTRLLPTAKTILCLGKLYNTPQPYSTTLSDSDRGWISRYAWGDDYHDVLRRDMTALVKRLPVESDYLICVDTAPLLERSYARQAGLGWIGRNTCLINEPLGSWFFLGEILTSLDLPPDSPPPDRCGTCTRCIEACPTSAIAPGGYSLDARLCISYFTIELRGPVPEDMHAGIGNHIFGCDICQDVCPWNNRAPVTADPAFQPRNASPPLEKMAQLTEQEFRHLFRHTPVSRAKYRGFLRNVLIAMKNSGNSKFYDLTDRLSSYLQDPANQRQ